jgi:hypothetical protein
MRTFRFFFLLEFFESRKKVKHFSGFVDVYMRFFLIVSPEKFQENGTGMKYILRESEKKKEQVTLIDIVNLRNMRVFMVHMISIN